MSKKDKATGLGADAFFEPPKSGRKREPETAEEEKPAKMRTSVMLERDVVALMIQMQGQATLSGGKRPTYSDIINAAVKAYAQQQDISAQENTDI